MTRAGSGAAAPPATTLEVHDLVVARSALGPGLRCGVFVQGCTLACPGCFNPHTHARGRGRVMAVDDVVAWALASRVDGVTLTGGEPTEQLPAVTALARRLRAAGLDSLILYSGRRMEEICAMAGGRELLELVDVLIDGRFDARQPEDALLRGSTNQEIYLLTVRHEAEEFAVRHGALVIRDSRLVALGFAAPRLARHLGGREHRRPGRG